MNHKEDLIAGRNAVIEALRAKKPIDKIFVLDGCQDGPIRTIVREAKKKDIRLFFMTLICMKSRVVIMIIQTHPFRKLLMKSLKVKEWMIWNVSKWIIKNLKK